MSKRRKGEFSARESFVIWIPTLLIVLLVFGMTYYFVLPAPPRTLVMTTGMEGGSYAVFGERYREVLARDQVRLDLRPSSGSVENLKRLMDKPHTVDVGFVQGGAAFSAEAKNLVSLGAICYSPLWVFYRGDETYDDLSQLKGKKITIGPEGSGARKFGLDLLKEGHAADPPTRLFDLTTMAAAKALVEGEVDVVITFGTTDSALVRKLLYSPGVKLMNFSQAEAYSRLFPSLSHVILPKGILDLAKKIPASDVHLLAPTTNLIIRDDLHPASIYLLLDAAVEIHGTSGWVHKAGEFPTLKAQDFPLSDQAEQFYKSGRPFLMNYLPFWAATFVERMIRILVPAGIILFPLSRIVPWLYTRRNRSKFYRWYGELKHLESEISEDPRTERAADYRTRLDQIEDSVNKVSVPVAFYDEVYTLREHIDYVRKKIAQLN